MNWRRHRWRRTWLQFESTLWFKLWKKNKINGSILFFLTLPIKKFNFFSLPSLPRPIYLFYCHALPYMLLPLPRAALSQLSSLNSFRQSMVYIVPKKHPKENKNRTLQWKRHYYWHIIQMKLTFPRFNFFNFKIFFLLQACYFPLLFSGRMHDKDDRNNSEKLREIYLTALLKAANAASGR